MDYRQPKGIRRKNLQCPFTWSTPVLSDEDLLHENDTLVLSADSWSLVINKLLLAYQCLMRDDVKRSRLLLVECYMPLMEVNGFFHCDSDLMNEYRTALKHVIDSTWAFVCCKTTPVKELESFLQSITPFKSMTDFQKSAVWGIRGRLSDNEDGLRAADVAISLNPNEGQWYFYKGFLLSNFRITERIATNGELKALEKSYYLRPTPESTVAYAVALTHQHRRVMDTKKGLLLLREAIKKWPDNPYVNLECGIAYYKNHTKTDDLIQAEKFLRNAVKLVGTRNCRAVCHALGSFLIHYKDRAEGKMYLHMASVAQK